MMNTTTSTPHTLSSDQDAAPDSVTRPTPTETLTRTLTPTGVLLAVYGLLVSMTLGFRITLAALGG